MKKILDNYLSTDIRGFNLIAKRCTDWANAHITDPAEVLVEITEAGGWTEYRLKPGMYLFGNMYNPELGLTGGVWTTSRVVNVDEDDRGRQWAETETGSRYLLLDPYSPPARSIGEVFNQIMEVAPEPLKEYLSSSFPFWAPETLWLNLTRAINEFVVPDSSDETSIKIYAILCNCTEDNIVHRLKGA